MKLTETLKELLVKKVIYDNIFEAVSPQLMSKMLDKFGKETSDDESIVRNYIESFDKYKNSLDPNLRDITRYTYSELKSLIDDLNYRKEWRKTLNETIKIYMSTEGLGRGAELDDAKINIKKFLEIIDFLPNQFKDILKIPYLKLTRILSDNFENVIREKGFKHLKESNPNATPEDILVRLNMYINSYGELPFYSKPIFRMDFGEFESIVDVLPTDVEDLGGEIDISDVKVVYEDDNVLVFLGDGKQHCINIRKKYAPDRSWCTSWERSGNYYYNYRLDQNLTLYYVINKLRDPSDVDYASVILVSKDGSKRLADGSNSGRYAGSTIVPWSEIVGKIPVIKNIEPTFKPIPLTDEEIEKLRGIKNLKVNNDAVGELGEEAAELWIELSSPDLTRQPQIYINLPVDLKKKYIGLGLDLNSEMISLSEPEVQKYYLSKKIESLSNKTLSDLGETDIALIKSPIFPKDLREKIKTRSIDVALKGLGNKDIKIDIGSNLGKYVSMFGFDDLIDRLPESLESFEFKSNTYLNIPIPKSFCKFKKLEIMGFKNVINSLPKCVGEMKELRIIQLSSNANLTSIPEEIFLLPNLDYINVGSNFESEFNEDKINEEREILGLDYLMISYM